MLSHGKRIDTYDVYSEERDCRCVVKVVRSDRRHEPHVCEAAVLEGSLLRDLAHPHLVRCYEVHADPVPGMVLETLTGATLGAVVEDGPLAVGDAALLGLQLVSVLSYLHRHGWLHLDVKPANIVVQAGCATLIDLSLAGPPGDGRPGAGTPGYLAPEQASGRDLTVAADVWGIGVTLFECLTGDLPHGNQETWSRRRRALKWATRRPPGFGHLPADLATLLRGCLERDPAGRPALADVRACLHALHAGS